MAETLSFYKFLCILLKESSSTLILVAIIYIIIPESSVMMLFVERGGGGGGGQGLTETFKLCSRQNPCILIPYLIQESNLIFVSLSKSAARSVFVLVSLSALFFTSHTFFYN